MVKGPRQVSGDGDPPSLHPPTPPPLNPFGNAHPGFGGTFVTEDSVLPGSLEFQGTRLIMWGGGNPLLVWDPGEALLERLTANRFVLTADGETITFTADDPDGLDEMLSQHSFGPVESAANGSATPAAPVVQMDPVPAPVASPVWPSRAELFPVPDPVPEERVPETPVFEPVSMTPKPSAYVEPVVDVVEDEAPAGGPMAGRRPSLNTVRAAQVAAVPDIDDTEEAGETVDEEGATMAELALSRAQKLKKVRPRRWLPNDIQTVAVKVGLVSGAIVVVMGFAFAILLILGGGEGSLGTEGDVSPTTSIVTVPTTAPTTAPLPPANLDAPVFDLSGAEFAERWNVFAAQVDEALLLSPNISTPFSLVMTPYMTFDGILDPIAGSLQLRTTPTGTTEGDRRILVAIALVIGTAEPSLTPDQRGQLVELLGLDLADPDITTIDGAATYNGLLYEMDYLEEESVLQFTVRPESSVVTAPTAAP